MHDGAIGWSNEHRPVVVDVDDGDLEAGGAPERRPPVIRGYHSQIKPLKAVQQTQRTDQTSVRVQRECV